MKRLILSTAVAGALALVGCGDSGSDASDSKAAKQSTPSAQEQAQTEVCSARANIKKQVDGLSAMTAATVTVKAVQSSLSSIAASVSAMEAAQQDLSPDRKQEVQDATANFKAAVAKTGSTLIKSVSLSDGKQQVQDAAQQLKRSYEQALQPVDCA
jgi:hypothetical protein